MPLAPFIRTDCGVHPSIDRAALLKFYHDLPLDVWNISSPSDLVGWEILRERHNIVDPQAVPCDLFVWGTGKPPDRRLTRVGGTPWLPKRIPWPDIDGVVPSFLCQFDFRDSRDLVGELPGDLLLVFVAEEDTMLSADAERMRFLWVSAAETAVIGPRAVPRPTHPFEYVCAWGVRHRSVDVPTGWDRAYAIAEDAEGSALCMLPVLRGTKIGGVPYDSQSIQRAVPAGYLCQLVSIQPSASTPWPWADRKKPLKSSSGPGGAYGSESELMIGDLGELTFYLRHDGSIAVDSACG
jgi:hypothetical protein